MFRRNRVLLIYNKEIISGVNRVFFCYVKYFFFFLWMGLVGRRKVRSLFLGRLEFLGVFEC